MSQSTASPHPIINPKLSAKQAAFLDANEVPHEVDAILWEAEKRGYWIYLAGPNLDPALTVSRRWEAKVVKENDGYTESLNSHAETALKALVPLYAWMRSQDDDAHAPATGEGR